MKIGELARLSGLTAHTLRYYERIGLIPFARRGRSKQREYDASILPWIAFLHRLRATGMPIRDMVRYAKLRELGPATENERRGLLQAHRARVRIQADAFRAALDVLDAKIAGYAGQPERRTNARNRQGRK